MFIVSLFVSKLVGYLPASGNTAARKVRFLFKATKTKTFFFLHGVSFPSLSKRVRKVVIYPCLRRVLIV